ncbi:MAG: biotin--[acetyl-CoA-carboxylase] ligase [Verrucomicrobiaceae bacterium]|nr:biotin--[acetyl-CoA-carboxylase] ligase [Verrucomicrobiaceae bacterium]
MTALNSQSIAELLNPDGFPWRFQIDEEVTSTSDLARSAGMAGEAAGLVIMAESQTNGRGQRSNRWITPKGQDLTMSLLLRPPLPLEQWPRLTTLAALAICRAIEAVVPLHPVIKWPNDIYMGSRKVSGLLAETFAGPAGAFLVLGIGLNVNATSFPEELQGLATSILRELPAHVQCLEREPLAAALLSELDRAMHLWGDGFTDVVAEVRSRSLLLAKQVRAVVDGREVSGKVLDLNHEGHLVLQLMDGSSQTLSSAADVRLVY